MLNRKLVFFGSLFLVGVLILAYVLNGNGFIGCTGNVAVGDPKFKFIALV